MQPSSPRIIPPTADFDRIADELADLASKAGRAILDVYDTDFRPRLKQDRSLVTDADEAAEEIIAAGLARRFPGLPIVAEEAMARGGAPKIADAFFLVDPLDGTREFVSRNGQFTVNIALVVDQRALAGVVYAPTSGLVYLGGECARRGDLVAGSPFRRAEAGAIRTREPEGGLVALVSRSHRNAPTRNWLARHDVADIRPAGSALKFGLLAEGRADVYPRLAPTSEWDTAAGHAVLEAAGGVVLTLDDAPLLYGKPGFVNEGFVAWGQPPA